MDLIGLKTLSFPLLTSLLSFTGFYVGYRISGSEETFSFVTVPTSEQLIIESNNPMLAGRSSGDHLTFNYTLDQLRKATKYTFVVQAFNSEGAGPYSGEIFANTFNNGEFTH